MNGAVGLEVGQVAAGRAGGHIEAVGDLVLGEAGPGGQEVEEAVANGRHGERVRAEPPRCGRACPVWPVC